VEAYNKDLQQFELFKDTKIAELEEVSKLLDMKTLFNPFEFIGQQPLIIWGEKPQDVYNRTVHSGNIGIASLDVIPQYAQQSLTLLKITESLMGDPGGLTSVFPDRAVGALRHHTKERQSCVG